MTLSCPVCHDIFLVTENCSSTICGHLFHTTCLSKWLQDNRNCPHCRQPCTLNTTHRVYLPESHFEKCDIMEKLNEVAIAKQGLEKQIKDLEKNNKKVEYELKVKKKQYQKILNRSRRIGKHKSNINIPRPGVISSSTTTTAASSSLATPVASTSQAVQNEGQPPTASSTKTPRNSHQERSKKSRNATRINRAKEYFRRKKAFYENNNNQAPANNGLGSTSAAAASSAGSSSSSSGNVMTV